MSQAIVNLRRIEYLRGLPPSEAEELARYSEFHRYPDRHVLFRQGEPSPGAFVVISGAVKLYRTDGRGKVQVLGVLEPGMCTGDVSVFDGGTTACTAEAYGEAEVMVVPAEVLRRQVHRSAHLGEVLVQHFAEKMRHLVDLVETLSLHSVPERVAQLLVDYHRRNPARSLVEFRETQEELAQCIGASREAFSRALRLLMDLGLIQSTFPVVRIMDVPKLQRYARG